MINLDDLYKIYMNARERAWYAYGKAADKSFDGLEKDELYQKALKVERRAWNRYFEAREHNGYTV